MSDPTAWIEAVRRSHDHLRDLLEGLTDDAITGPSYDDGWSIAHVASHLGSQAEIFQLGLDAGLGDRPTPGPDEFHPIWDEWNAMAANEQVGRSIGANEALVSRIEGLDEEDRERFDVELFGRRADLSGFLAMRLGEHAVHTWDVEVALDPGAGLLPESTELLVDVLADRVPRLASGLTDEDSDDDDEDSDDEKDKQVVGVVTTAPDRTFTLTIGADAALEPAERDDLGDDVVELPAEAFVRLLHGRLDPGHTPDGVVGGDHLDRLREIFRGF